MSVDDNHLKKIIVNRMKSENIRYHYCDYNHEITFYYKNKSPKYTNCLTTYF